MRRFANFPIIIRVMATAVVVVAVAAVLLIAIEQDNRDIAISNIHDTGHY